MGNGCEIARHIPEAIKKVRSRVNRVTLGLIVSEFLTRSGSIESIDAEFERRELLLNHFRGCQRCTSEIIISGIRRELIS